MKPVYNSPYTGLTSTIGELIAFLQTYPPDMPVLAEWEGVWAGVRIADSRVEKGYAGLPEDALIFDVDNYG